MNSIPETHMLSVAPILQAGGVVVLRTDTIYGIVACADNQFACEYVYRVKGRDAAKPCIVLIADSSQIWDAVSREAFDTAYDEVGDEPTSIVVPAGEHVPAWLPHENGSIAFRVPDKHALRQLILTTGPLIAPSANPSGKEPAATIEQAQDYFGDKVGIYVDGGETKDVQPSRIIRVGESGEIERIR